MEVGSLQTGFQPLFAHLHKGPGWEHLAPSSQSSRAPGLGGNLSCVYSCFTLRKITKSLRASVSSSANRVNKCNCLVGLGRTVHAECSLPYVCRWDLRGGNDNHRVIAGARVDHLLYPSHLSCLLLALYQPSGVTAILVGPRGKRATEKGFT